MRSCNSIHILISLHDTHMLINVTCSWHFLPLLSVVKIYTVKQQEALQHSWVQSFACQMLLRAIKVAKAAASLVKKCSCITAVCRLCLSAVLQKRQQVSSVTIPLFLHLNFNVKNMQLFSHGSINLVHQSWQCIINLPRFSYLCIQNKFWHLLANFSFYNYDQILTYQYTKNGHCLIS